MTTLEQVGTSFVVVKKKKKKKKKVNICKNDRSPKKQKKLKKF